MRGRVKRGCGLGDFGAKEDKLTTSDNILQVRQN